MWDARMGRRTPRRQGILGALTVAGIFGIFHRKPPASRVRVEVRRPPAAPPPKTVTPPPPDQPLKQDLRFLGLHADIDPAPNVRWGEMTCQDCGRQFRYFLNSGGGRTVSNCPGCGRQYRV